MVTTTIARVNRILNKRPCVVGLRSCSSGELQAIKSELFHAGVKYEHKTHRSDSNVKLPYNGVLIVR